jgi:multimeric flavodoxin WrbA
MKMLGLTCGSKNGNSEILIKEALMGSEELGVDVDLIRMLDLDIRPCMACSLPCPNSTKGPEGCVMKDDGVFLYNAVMDCDALIISAPVYTKTPPGYLKAIGDRVLGPKVDVAFKKELKKLKETGDPMAINAWIDERSFKNRVGGFISVGGATSPDWVNLGLPNLHMMTFSLQIAIVDQIQVMGAGMRGSVLVNRDGAVQRARQLGRHVAEQMGRHFDDVLYKGDSPGTCPVCHLDMVAMKDSYVECAVCGIHGELKIVDNKITVVFPEEAQKKSVLELEGKRIHFYEIREVTQGHMPKVAEIKRLADKYKSYKPLIKPPSKQKSASA